MGSKILISNDFRVTSNRLSVHVIIIFSLYLVLGHGKCVDFVKKYGLPFLMVGGGGYTIRNVSRCWTYETSVALGAEIANELPYNDYFEYFGPDFKLHISPSNMANQNQTDYLDKIKYTFVFIKFFFSFKLFFNHEKFDCRTRLFENLRMLPHAPGVQVQGTVLKI